MPSREEKVAAFRAQHESGCFIMPNPWDAGGARMMAALGFPAVATTSSGYAFSIGRKDSQGDVTLAETLAHATLMSEATDLPVNGDFEDCYAPDAEGVGETIRLAAETGLAGVSIEDRWLGGPEPMRSFDDALVRVEAAVNAARRHNIVLTARADGIGKGAYGLEEAIRRLQAFDAAGADVLYAPGVKTLSDLKTLCTSVGKPVNHVIGQGLKGLSRADFAAAGVRRISLGGSFARAVNHAMRETALQVSDGEFSALDAAPGFDTFLAPQTIRR
jgi:2-methylisocitrate lyase-like PEP mutase family enzyme